MARHSNGEKPTGSWLTFFQRHTGVHTDEPILELDQETKPQTAFGNLQPDMFGGPARPVNWDQLAAPKRRHRWTWYLGSGAFAAAVGLIVFAACSALSTDPGAYTDQTPAAVSPSPCSRCWQSPDPTDGRQVTSPAAPVVMMTITPPTSGTSPQRVEPRGTVTVTAPAPVAGQPSGESPSPYMSPAGQPSEPVPTVTTTQTVTEPARPAATVTQTVRATQTVYLPRPRVTVTVTLAVPFISP